MVDLSNPYVSPFSLGKERIITRYRLWTLRIVILIFISGSIVQTITASPSISRSQYIVIFYIVIATVLYFVAMRALSIKRRNSARTRRQTH